MAPVDVINTEPAELGMNTDYPCYCGVMTVSRGYLTNSVHTQMQ
ncbi:8879_t:CDS:1, partial [Rhizophagus irregularis]